MSDRGKRKRRRFFVAGVTMCLLISLLYLGYAFVAKNRAIADLTWHDPEGACHWLESLRRLRELSPEENALLLRAHRKRGDLAGFSEVAQRLEAQGEQEVVARQKILLVAQTGDLTQVESQVLALLQNPKGDGADICEAIANGYVRNYQIEKAAPVLETWRSEYPADPQVMVILGRVEEHRGDWEKALEYYNEALDRRPGFGPAAYNAARILLKRKRPEEALAYYDLVAQWSSDPAPAAVGRAHALRMMDRAAEARQLLLPYAESREQSDERIRAFRLLGEVGTAAVASVYSELGQIEFAAENFDDACHWLDRAVKENPRDHTLRYLLARALIACGRKEDSKRHFDAYQTSVEATKRLDQLMDQLRSSPNDPVVRCEMGCLFLEHVSESQGVVWLNSALQIDPSLRAAHEALAEFFESKLKTDPGNVSYQQRAKRHRRAVQLDPS